MSAPCSRCGALGWVTGFDDGSSWGSIKICPTCAGLKYLPDEEDKNKSRTRLGVCKFCSHEIYFPASDIPCIVGRRDHVIQAYSAEVKAHG